MNHRLFLGVAAAALIAGSTFSNAQSPAGSPGGGAPAASERAAPSGGGSMGGGAAGGSASERGAPSATPMNRDAAEPRSGGKQSTQSNETAPNAKGGMDRNADTKDGAKEINRNADSKDGARDSTRNADTKSGATDTNRNAQSRDGADKADTTTGQAAAGGKQLTTEQRSQVTTVIRETKVAPVTNINFSVSVGTRVPREVRFHPLPARIVTIYPDWRGYEFFLARDEIIVVNPRTLEIVAVLPA